MQGNGLPRRLCEFDFLHFAAIGPPGFEQVPSVSLSSKNVFYIKNFDTNETKNVILECAVADGVPISEEIALTIANDLSDDNEIRPAELQIVCTALRGNFDLKHYKFVGGAPGILSHHVAQTIEKCPEAKIARLILRTLCDLPRNAKRSPLSTSDLVVSISDRRGEQLTTKTIVVETLARLETERLVERTGSDHDSQ
jgi:hypothetical protein